VGYVGSDRSLYGYASEMPMHQTDPMGLSPACVHRDAIFFQHGGPGDLPMAIQTEGTVCGHITVAPGTCPGDLIFISVRYSAYDPVTGECDTTAKRELLEDFGGWIYTGSSSMAGNRCTITGGMVTRVGYRDCPEVNWRIVCGVSCGTDRCVCTNDGGRIQIAPKIKEGSRLRGRTESIVVDWRAEFSESKCMTSPCKARIGLAQTGAFGLPGRPRLMLDDGSETDAPQNPPCPLRP